MSSPRSVVWEMEPHTAAKHVILRKYLEAWFPILSSHHSQVLYFDGFSGPGRYSGGEPGSPLVALEAAVLQADRLSDCVFVFAESDTNRARHLDDELRRVFRVLPPNICWEVLNTTSSEALDAALEWAAGPNLATAPMFAFLDPFGFTGIPFTQVERVLRRRSSEVFVNLMTSSLNRWAGELPERVAELMGSMEAAQEIARSRSRVETVRTLYAHALGRCASRVRGFSMTDESRRPIYDLFFAGNNDLGYKRMKEAMWKADETGGFTFSDATNPLQPTLFSSEPERDLVPMLWAEFQGRRVPAREVFDFTWFRTPFLEKHARAALALLKTGCQGQRINVAAMKTDGRPYKRGFPEGAVITFGG